jgi:NAD(P)H-dependent FMN reductase
MARVIGISGSLRKGSYNTALLRAAAGLAPPGLEVEVASIKGIPLYDGDLEVELGVPPEVQQLKEAIAAADGLILATPEYNNSIPGVLKNTIDWVSRPPKDSGRVFGSKPIALMGATPGGGGTALSQNTWLPILRTLGLRLWSGKSLYIARAYEAFDEAGNLTDEKIKERLAAFMKGFAEFV